MQPVKRLDSAIGRGQMMHTDANDSQVCAGRAAEVAAMKFADESPWPDPIALEEGVFAPEEKQ